MITQLVYFSLMLGMFSAYAADDITSSLANLHLDESPAGYMQRLWADEARVVDDVPGKFILIHDCYVSNVQDFMQQYELADYFKYIRALAFTKKLSDKQKLKSRYTNIPPIRALRKKTKEERQKVLIDLVSVQGYDANYPIKRLLMVPFCKLDVDLNKSYHWFCCNTLLHWGLCRDDLPLIQKLLRHGANPNIGSYPILSSCKSFQAALLCLQYGAHFTEQHKEKDIIWHLLCNPSTNNTSPDVLRLFLEYAILNASNEFGKQWFQALRKHPLHASFNGLLERIELIGILLNAGCYYGEDQMRRLADDIIVEEYQQPEIKVMAKEKINSLVAQDLKKRKPLSVALQERSLTGKPLARRSTNHIRKLYLSNTVLLDNDATEGFRRMLVKQGEVSQDVPFNNYYIDRLH